MTEAPAPPPRKPRLRFLRWFGRGLSVVLVLAVFAAMAAALYMRGKPIMAPDWVQERIESRIAEVLPEARVSFGEMVFVVEDDWRPRVRLRNIVVRTPDGAEIVRFNEFKAAFAAKPLLQQQVQPQSVSLSGVFARLRRAADGSVALSGVQAASAPSQQAATLPELVGQLDQILQRPALAALEQVDLRALTLRYEDVRAGRGWTVDGGRLRVEREANALTVSADLAVLSGGAGVATLAANYSSAIGETAADFGISFEGVAAEDIAAQGPAFAWMDVLRAPISGAVRSGLTEAGRFQPLNATLQIGAGVVQPNPGTLPIPFEGARSYFSYEPRERLLRFDELSVRSKWLTADASGAAELGLEDVNGPMTDLVGQFRISDLTANPMDIYADAKKLAAADIDFRLSLNPFQITIGRLNISDQGQTLRMNGAVAAQPDGWHLAMDGRMDAITPERLLAFWPVQAAAKTRKWLTENLHEGKIRNINLALRRSPGAAPRTYLAYEFSEASVGFMRNMPPIQNGIGHFTLQNNRLVVSVDQGHVTADVGGDVAMDGSSFIIPDIRIRPGTPSVVNLKTRSSVTAALSLLNRPPLSVMDKARLPVELASGEAVLSGTINAPLKKKRKKGEVTYDVAGTLFQMRSDVLVKDRVLAAEQLAFEVDNTQLVISGAGELDGVPFDGTWRQPIGPGSDKSSLKAQVALNENALDTFGVALPDGAVSGRGDGAIDVRFQRGRPPQFQLTSDLQGIGVSVPQVSWAKPARQQGRLYVAGQLGNTPQIDRLEIAGPGLNAQGAVTLAENGGLERVRFDQLRVGDWLNVPVDLVGQGKGRPVQVVLRGGTLDMRKAEFDEAGPRDGPPAPPMLVELNSLRISDTIALTEMRGQFLTGNGLEGSFRARVNGGTAVQGRLVPQNGRTAVELTAVDAGGVLRSADLLRQVVGGTMSLKLLPVGSGGAFDGQLLIRDVRIKDAPGIAALLNAISVVGLINELNGDGIYFDTVDGRFRLTPDQLTLAEGSAVGASMGLSMDGVYALGSNEIAMQGVLTPVYLLNGIGSVLTRRGEGLIGFNYTLKGPAKKPNVAVNPLSALTPGLFREIFRAPPPKVPEVEGNTTLTVPRSSDEIKRPVAGAYEGR